MVNVAATHDDPLASPQPVTPQSRRALRAILVVGAAVITAFVSLTWVWIWAESEHSGVAELAYESSLFVPPVIAFFGLFYLRSDLGDALAGGFMVLYFTVMTTVLAFSTIGDLSSSVSTLRGTLFGSLTSVINVVVAFYFGSGAAVQLGRMASRKDNVTTVES
jgi:hypothetical protein